MSAPLKVSPTSATRDPISAALRNYVPALRTTFVLSLAINLLMLASPLFMLQVYDRVLGSRSSFPLMARYLLSRGGKLDDYREQDKLLFWYVHTFLWGRYAGSTETVLNQDLSLIQNTDGALDRLIEQLRRNRGDLRLKPQDFIGWSKGARFYPALYMMTRVGHAKDWGSGLELKNTTLGALSSLQIHHIFPKAQLKKYGYSLAEINAIANFTFLTKETNIKISDRLPAEYLPEFIEKHPGSIESHWIPNDPELWKIEKPHCYAMKYYTKEYIQKVHKLIKNPAYRD